jgi:predicted ATPase
MLCWATILLSPELPSLLVIEEPEIGIHVSWLPILAAWIKKASEKTQVIVSTHSPDLLDYFTENLPNVLVMKQSESLSHRFCLMPLTPELLKDKLDEGWQLGDLYRVGDSRIGGWRG